MYKRSGHRDGEHLCSESLLQLSPKPAAIKMASTLLLPEPLPSFPESLRPKLRDRPWSASTQSPLVPESLKFISQEEIDCYRLVADTNTEEAGNAIKQLVDEKLYNKGAMLVRGLLPVFPTNKEYGMLVEKMGKSFSYSAGTASRVHDPDAEGESPQMTSSPGHGEVMLGADEPPEVTIEMHLEMSYNRDMPARIYFYCHKVPPSISLQVNTHLLSTGPTSGGWRGSSYLQHEEGLPAAEEGREQGCGGHHGEWLALHADPPLPRHPRGRALLLAEDLPLQEEQEGGGGESGEAWLRSA